MLLASHMVYLFARALANHKLKAFLTGHKKWMTVSKGSGLDRAETAGVSLTFVGVTKAL